MRLTTLRVANFILRHDNPGLPAPWVDAVARHLVPAATKRAALQLYPSTRTAHLEALAARLHRHDIDALVVFGDADVYIPAEQARRQPQAFPRAEVHVLRGVGHWSWLEQTDQVAAHVVPFLRQRAAIPITFNN
jgi:pimeloyl-ACP methyl ester carboxylesterase